MAEILEEDERDVPIVDDSPGIPTFTLQEMNQYTNGFGDGNKIGSGTYGTVYRGVIEGRPEPHLNNLQIAIKVSLVTFPSSMEQWENEINYLAKLNHPNIIKLIGKGRTTTRVFLVLPLLERGDVLSNLQDVNWDRALKILYGSALALQELQREPQPLILRDFKSSNILLDDEWNPVLCDFGGARPEGSVHQFGTGGFTHPQARITGLGNKESDMYSFCVLVLQLIMKQADAGKLKSENHLSNIASKNYKEHKHACHEDIIQSGCGRKRAKKITKLGLECTKKDDERITIDDVLKILQKLNGTYPRKGFIQKMWSLLPWKKKQGSSSSS